MPPFDLALSSDTVQAVIRDIPVLDVSSVPLPHFPGKTSETVAGVGSINIIKTIKKNVGFTLMEAGFDLGEDLRF